MAGESKVCVLDELRGTRARSSVGQLIGDLVALGQLVRSEAHEHVDVVDGPGATLYHAVEVVSGGADKLS